jgi:hypothetical protein
LREALPVALALKAIDEIPRGGLVGILAALHRFLAPRARAAAAEREVFVYRMEVTETEGRLRVARAERADMVARTAVEREAAAVVEDLVNLIAEDGLFTFESALADDVQRAAETARGHVGCRDFGDLDARDVAHRNFEEGERPGVAAARAHHVAAVDGDAGSLRGKTAERDLVGDGAGIVEGHAREDAQELADVFIAAVAVFVDGDEALDVRCGALLVHGKRLRAHFAVGHHGELRQSDGLARAAATELEVALRDRAGRHADCGGLPLEADVSHAQPRHTGRHADDAIRAIGLGHRFA